MEDTISRKKAIDELCRMLRACFGADDEELDAVTVTLNNMPSAQPETHEERTKTHACDLISRQAAIEAFDNLEWYHQNQNKDMVRGANSERHQAWYKEQDVYKTLEQLPSVQPEIVRCGQCKYAEVADKEDAQDGYTCQFHRGSIWFSGSYCSWAERRTDERTD